MGLAMAKMRSMLGKEWWLCCGAVLGMQLVSGTRRQAARWCRGGDGFIPLVMRWRPTLWRLCEEVDVTVSDEVDKEGKEMLAQSSWKARGEVGCVWRLHGGAITEVERVLQGDCSTQWMPAAVGDGKKEDGGAGCVEE